jgi:hypothetical protein
MGVYQGSKESFKDAWCQGWGKGHTLFWIQQIGHCWKSFPFLDTQTWVKGKGISLKRCCHNLWTSVFPRLSSFSTVSCLHHPGLPAAPDQTQHSPIFSTVYWLCSSLLNSLLLLRSAVKCYSLHLYYPRLFPYLSSIGQEIWMIFICITASVPEIYLVHKHLLNKL